MLMTLCITGAWADEVTEKQAQDLAKSFVNSYFGKKGGDRSGLKSQGQMEKLGFYVFNMTDKGGFVIVSNESETTPILGYSETGSIELDPDKMPENMRNWLQGYADEIAWLKQHKEIIKTESVKKAKTRSGDSKIAIEPLISTQWNQSKPYNNQTPYYGVSNNKYVYSKDYVEGYSHCVTGCVATAMAQVMNYHKWPQAKTSEIPAYQWHSIWLPDENSSLSAVTFDWTNMKDTYAGTETDVTAEAVSTLMKYCGYSVEMNYGPSSGSNSINVANALNNYFDYKSTTTCITRSFYSYNKWVDIIYYELAHNRPVVYGGQSSSGGHEFVCDGYKYENGTDYFHINWGWGGKSDDYYVLSVLNPYEGEGVGGSTSRDGYSNGQDAVIGIQPSTRTGDMSEMMDITPNVVNLTMNGMTLSHSSVVVNTEVTATLNITNNNAIDYNGDIYIGYISNNALYLLKGNVFSIPARKTRDCVIKFKPNGIGTYNLVLCLPNDHGGYSTDCNIWASLPVVASNSGIPTNLAITDISSKSAQLSWTENGSATKWKVGIKADGAEDFTIIDGDVTVNPYTLTGLSSKTEYTVKVRPSDNESAWSPELSFTTIAEFPAPENLTVSEVTPTSAKISWTGNANSYDVRYGVLPDGVGDESIELKYDNGTYKTNTGYGNGSEYTWGVMYPSNLITSTKLEKIAFYINDENSAAITVRIYSGGSDSPGTLKYEGSLNPPSVTKLTLLNIPFETPIEILRNENLWITLAAADNYPAIKCTDNTVPNNTWRYNGSFWVNNDTETGYGWMIRGYLKPESLDAVSWTTISSLTEKTYSLTNLQASENYVVQVCSNYDSKSSDWVTATISKALELGNEETKNATLIGSWNNYTTNVTLKDRTLYKDGSWNTLCLPFNVDLSDESSPLYGADIRTLDNASFSEGVLSLNFTEKNNVTNINAGTPYIIKWNKANGYEEANAQTRDINNPVFTNVLIDKTINNKVCNLDNGRSVTFKGTYTPISYDQTNRSILFLGDNNKLYFPKSGAKINSCRAYFELTGFEMADVAQARIFVNDGNATGIVSIDNENRIIVNEAEGWYSLDGRKLSGKPSAKGVYIRDGKKIVIK